MRYLWCIYGVFMVYLQSNEVPIEGNKKTSKEALGGAIQWEYRNSNLTLNQINEKFKKNGGTQDL